MTTAPYKLLPAPHATDTASLANILHADLNKGLAATQVAEHRARFGRNVLRQHRPASLVGILINQFRSRVIYLLAAAAIFAGALSEWADSIAIIAVLAINSAIGFVTELRALRSMDALRQLSIHSVRVRRNGQPQVLPAPAWIAIVALSIVPVLVREMTAIIVRVQRRTSAGR